MKISNIPIWLGIIAIFVIVGCSQQQIRYVCPDGSTVSDSSLCPKEEKIVFCLDKTKGICFGRNLDQKCAGTDNYGCCPSEIQYPNEELCDNAKENLLSQVDTGTIGKCIIKSDLGPPTMIDEECKIDSDCYRFASAMGVRDTSKVKCLK